MTNPYFINVASNFIFLSILVVLGLVVHYLTKRRALLKFFRIGKTKRINLYLSRLRVSPFAAIGVDCLPRSFGGLAIPFAESRYITLFQRLFNYGVPVVASQPGLLKWLLVFDVEVVSLTSPL